MSGLEPSSSEVFDVDKIRQLVELMKQHDLSEIDLRQAEQRIKLRRGEEHPAPTYFAAPPAAPPQAAQAPAAAAPSSTPAAAPAAVAADGANIVYIRSPMVGTFYTKPNPNAEPYVRVGDHVNPDTVVCIIEAMKMFNEIQAEVSGQIVAVLVDGEEPVDVDKPLFKVDTSK